MDRPDDRRFGDAASDAGDQGTITFVGAPALPTEPEPPVTPVADEPRRVWPLIVWVVALAIGTALFHLLGRGALAAPPLDPQGAAVWFAERDALTATVAVLRLIVLALAWYLVGVTTIGLLARALRAVRLVRLADALTVPVVRRLLQQSLGLSLAASMVVGATPSASGLPGAPSADAPENAVTMTMTSLPADDATTGSAPDATTGSAPEATTDSAPDAMPGSIPGVVVDGSTSAPPDAGGAAAGDTAARSDGTDTPLPLEIARGLLDERRAAVAEAQITAGDADGEAGSTADAVEEASRTGPDDGGIDPGSAGDSGPGSDQGSAGDSGPGSDHGSDHDHGEAGAQGRAEQPDLHEVRSGESLWSIAVAQLRAVESAADDAQISAYWERLIEANRDLLADPDNPDLIFPGQTLRIPEVAS